MRLSCADAYGLSSLTRGPAPHGPPARPGATPSDAPGSPPGTPAPAPLCHCQALRQAARRVSALYDAALAPLGLRISQYGILARLQKGGPRGIQALAADLVMDRTTLGRNIRPLERDGLLAAVPDPADRRARLLAVTPAGAALLRRAAPAWQAAQGEYEARYGADAATRLHAALAGVVAALHTPSP